MDFVHCKTPIIYIRISATIMYQKVEIMKITLKTDCFHSLIVYVVVAPGKKKGNPTNKSIRFFKSRRTR